MDNNSVPKIVFGHFYFGQSGSFLKFFLFELRFAKKLFGWSAKVDVDNSESKGKKCKQWFCQTGEPALLMHPNDRDGAYKGGW